MKPKTACVPVLTQRFEPCLLTPLTIFCVQAFFFLPLCVCVFAQRPVCPAQGLITE